MVDNLKYQDFITCTLLVDDLLKAEQQANAQAQGVDEVLVAG